MGEYHLRHAVREDTEEHEAETESKGERDFTVMSEVPEA